MENARKLVSPLLAARGVELVDLLRVRGRRRSTLRFLVTRPEGITLDECARLNQEIGQLFDQEDVIQERYVLEVSSPGLDRPMKSTRDFQRKLGKLIRVVLHQPLNKQNVWKGRIEGIDEDNLIIRTEDEQTLHIPRENIARANLEVEL